MFVGGKTWKSRVSGVCIEKEVRSIRGLEDKEVKSRVEKGLFERCKTCLSRQVFLVERVSVV